MVISVGFSVLIVSIIIVGVGEEDFSQMKQLDSDKTDTDKNLLKIGKWEAQRDIVQFIDMKTGEGEEEGKREKLAKEVLQEVPQQVTEWMNIRKFATVVDVE